jgi:hypothetical protein
LGFGDVTGLINTIAVRTGLAERVVARLILAGAIVTALLAALGGWLLWLHFHDAAVAERDRAASNVRVLRQNGAAQEAAAGEQAVDDRALAAQQTEMHDAIRAGADTAPDPAHVRLNCVRLMRAGADTDRLSACGGLAGGHRAGAGPDP